MKRYLFVVGGLALFAAVVALAITWRQVTQLRTQSKRLNEFCVATRWAIEEDRSYLTSGDSKKVQEAVTRFYTGQALYHSVASIQYCIPAETLPSMAAQCTVSEDPSCRVKIADEVLKQLPKVP